jgi:hypothetical protein
MGIPGVFHGSESMTMHATRDCTGCGRPLIWFHDSEELPPGWRINDAEERRQARTA